MDRHPPLHSKKSSKKYLIFKLTACALGFALVAGGIATPEVYAAPGVPKIISYQGRLTDSGGNLLGGSGTTYYFKFSIWDNATVGSGNRVWPTSVPTSVSKSVRQGVFSVNIGDTANGYPDTLNYEFAANDTVYLQVEVSSDNATFETLSPRQRVTASAFADVSGSVRGTGGSTIGTTSPIGNSALTIEASTTTAIPITIRGASGQTANLFAIQNSSGSSLLSVNNSGGIFGSSTLQITGDTRLYGNLNATNGLTALGQASTTQLSVFNGLYVGGTATTTILGSATSTFGAGVETAALNITGTATSTFANGINLASGCIRINGTCLVDTTGITSLGAEFSPALTGTSQTFATSSDANITLTITSSGSTHTFTPGWTGTLAATRGGTGQGTYAIGDILYADTTTSLARLTRGSNGTVLKISGGIPTWGADLTSGGGGAGAWATTSDSLAIYPSDTGYVVLIGTSATTTTGNILEVVGNSKLGGALTVTGLTTSANLLVTGSTTLQNFTGINATTTNATTTNLAVSGSSALGTVISGSWNGSTIGAAFGGTGISSVTANQLLVGNPGGTGWTQIATSSLGLKTTDVAEGNNLYYTDARVQAFIHASTTIPKLYTNNTFSGNNTFNGSLTFGTLNGPLDVRNGVVGATTSIGVLYGGTGLTTAPTFGQLLVGNNTGGYTLTATSSLGLTFTDISGTLGVARGGTGATSFPQGWIYSDGGTGALNASSSPTVNYITATSTTATSTLPKANITTLTLGSDFVNDITGSGLTTVSGALTLDRTGDWTGTFDGQEGTYYLDARNLNDFGVPFYSFFSATNTDALAEGVTNLYFTDTRFNNRFDIRLTATTTLPKITTLANLTTTGALNAGSITSGFGSIDIGNDALTAGAGTFSSLAVSGLTTLGQASTTMFSSYGPIYIGSTATSTLQGTTAGTSTLQGFLNVTGTNSTSTFSGGLAALQLNVSGAGTSTIAGGIDLGSLNVKGAGTSTFTNGISLAAGCFKVNGSCIGGVSSVSNADGSLTISPTNGAVVASLNLGNANSWTALQQFQNQASTTMFSSYGPIYIGSTATSTLQGTASGTSTLQGFLNVVGTNSTSTFSSGVQAGGLNVTGSATSTFANGISIAAGCFKINGVCLVDTDTGITSLGAQYSNPLLGTSQTFATSTDTNIVLTITSSGSTHTFAPGWTGTLAAGRGGTGISSPTAAGILLGTYAGGGWQQLATSSLGLKTTDVTEGTNLYYTDARVNAYIHASTTIPKTYTNNTFSGNNIFNGSLTFGTLNGPLDVRNGIVGATTSIGVLYGGTGLTSAPSYGNILVGNSNGGYTLTATSSLGLSLADLTGTLGVSQGGTGATNFGQGWIYSNGGTGALNSSTSPTVAYVISTSTSATSTFFMASTTALSVGNKAFFNAASIAGNTTGSLTITGTGNGTIHSLVARDVTYSFSDGLGAGFSISSGSTVSIFHQSAIRESSTGVIGWSSSVNANSNNNDIGFSRLSSGKVGLGNGTQGNASSTLIVGTLGIGTTSPYAALSVSGQVVADYFTATTTATSTFTGGFQTALLNVTGTATSTFANGVNVATGCFAINGTCMTGGVTSVSNADGSLTISPTTGLVVASLNTANTNTWTGAQTFTALTKLGQASSTRESIVDRVYIGGTATTTIVGDAATSTFSGGVSLASGNVNVATNGVYLINNAKVLDASSLGSGILNSSLTSIGTLSSLNVSGQTTLAQASSTRLSIFNELYVGGTATTTILGSATSTFGAGIAGTALNITGTATSTFAQGINLASGCFAVNGGCISGSGATGITSLGAEFSPGQSGASQTFATTSDANIVLTITSGSNIHTFAPSWTGVLAAGRGGTGISNPSAAGILLGSYAGGGWQQLATSSLGLKTTDVTEGTNLYWTNDRFDARLAASTTIPTLTTLANLTTTGALNAGSITSGFGSIDIGADALTAGAGSLTSLSVSGLTSLFQASSTRLSVLDTLYIGSTATSTLQGNTSGTSTLQGFLNVSGTNSTSTFSGGLAALQLNVSGAGTSTLAGGMDLGSLNVKGSGTSTFANGISLAAGCFKVNGSCVGGVNTVSNADGTLTISPTAGAVVASLNLSNANSWTGLQQFQSQASTTLLSSYGPIYIGSTATSTIQGTTAGTSTLQGFLNVSGTNSTSTFSGGLASTYLNLTGASATSTAANGFNLSGGCYAIGGSCIGGVSSVSNADGSLTISPTSGAVVASLNKGNANSWTALQQFQSNASTTMFSSYGPIYIGSTATSTLQGTAAGTSTLQGFLNVSGTNSTSTFSGGLAALQLNISGAGTSTIAGGIDLSSLNVKGSGTSTFANGIDLAAGCVRVGGSCVGGVNSVSNADGSLTISPTAGAVVASLNVGNANSWTALQKFQAQASTTMFSSYGPVYIGSTATSTLQGTAAGTSTLQGFLDVTGTNSTSTFSAGLTATNLNLTGAATNTFANGISLAAGCVKVNGSCIGGVSSVSNANGTLTISPTSGAVVASLNLTNANSWTALQQFQAQASTTMFSSYGPIYIGSTATSSLQGDTAGTSTLQGFLNVSGTNSTSTFSGGLAATYLNLTGATATSTAAKGFNLAGGCYAIGGSCIGGVSSVSNGDGTLTISPTTGAVVASLNKGNANSWTALQQFQAQASTTMLSSYGPIYIGSTATSTLQGTTAGTSTLQGFLNVSGTNSTSTFSGGLAALQLNVTGAGTSTIAGGVDLNSLNVKGAGTSTFANGIDLAAGCFKVNGSCVGGVSSVSNADSSLTISPTSGAVVASLNVGNSNSWTALQKFQSQASTTMFSSYGPVYIGSTATSTLQGTAAGTSTLQGFLNVSGTNSTSTFSGGLAATNLNLTGAAATNTFANGIALAAGCVTVNGSCIGGVSSVSNANGTLTISPTAGAVVASLNLTNANSWTALQQFQAQASTTMFSSYGPIYIGSTATSTIQGTAAGTSTLQGFLNVSGTNSTSTFSGGLASTYLNLTGASATSTAANGFNLGAGCYAIGGACIGGVSSVSNGNGTLTISPTTGAVVASLNLGNANSWTALQQFNGNASSTMESVLDTVYIGRTATSTLQGTTAGTSTLQGFLNVSGTNSTSTFSGGLGALQVNVTGAGTSTIAGGIDINSLNVKGAGTSTYANGISLAAGCFKVNGVCIGGVNTVSNADSSLTISPTTGAVVASLNVGNSNSWTALQKFQSQASTTMFSSYGPVYIGSTATSTLQGDTAGTSTLQGFLNVSGTNSTSTFSGGLAATYLNLTGASATSTFANGLSLAAGCVRVNGSCIGGVNTVSNADSSLTISPTSGAVVASLNVGNSNSWTALQKFQSQASTTMFSSYGPIYIGSTATSTLQGTAAGTSTLQGFLTVSGTNSTSTFSGGLDATYLNLTGATATSTAAKGINLAAGCYAIGGVCIGGSSGSVSSVSNADGTLTISPTTGVVVASLNTGNANSWTALQKFQSQASTTMFSSFGPIFIGSTATSTLQGDTAGTSTLQGFLNVSGTNSTSTFSGGLAALQVNVTGAGTSTIAGGIDLNSLNLKGSATSTFANGISLAAGCFRVNGSCVGGVNTVSNADSSLTISPTTGAVVASLNVGNSNSWTALQKFQAQASTTMFSSYGPIYIGSTATSTLQGDTAGTSTLQGFLNVSGTNSTSTFSGGLAATYLNLTGGSATSTFANGLSLAAGCVKVNGVCIGGVASVSNSDSTLTISPTSGAVVASLNLGNINSWTALQKFQSQASTTMFSSYGPIYIGSSATSTLQGTTAGTSTLQGFLDVSGTNSTSTFSGGLAATYLNLTGASATSTFANGISLAAGCFKVNGSCVGGVSSVSNSDSTLTISPTTGAVVASLNLTNSNSWTGLQKFQSQASTTMFSSYGPLYIGSTATSTLQGTTAGTSTLQGFLTVSGTNSTSTFSGGLEATYLNLTGSSATSTFANGISLAAGCFKVNGACISAGGSSQWTTSGIHIYYNTGNVGIGTTSPFSALSVSTTTASSPTTSLFAVASSTNATLFNILGNGNVGIGTTSPYNALSVVGTTTSSTFEATSTATSTFAGGIKTAGLQITGTATSTFSQGISLAAGCFAIGTTCIGSGGSSQWTTTGIHIFYNTGNVGIGTTSPFSALSVSTTTASSPFTSLFAVASSTNVTLFNVLGNGNVGIGTSSPYAKLSIVGQVAAEYFSATSTNATSTFNGSLAVGQDVEGDAPVQLGIDANAWTMGYNSSDKSFRIASSTTLISNVAFTLLKGGNVGIGSTTPFSVLSVSSTTSGTPFTSLFAVSSSTNATLFNVLGSGNVGIGTTTPGSKLSVVGSVHLDSNVVSFGSTTATSLIFEVETVATTSIVNAKDNAWSIATSSANVPIFSVSTRSSPQGRIGIATSAPFAKFSINQGVSDINAFAIGSSSATSLIVTSAGLIGIGTTSPFSQLSIGSASAAPSTPLFAIASSTNATLFNVLGNGFVGIGTTTPQATFALNGSLYLDTGTINVASTSATGVFWNYLASATTTVPLKVNAWNIATSSAAGGNSVMSISSDSTGATTTISFFVSTSTGITAGSGASLSNQNYIFVGNGKKQAGLAVVNGGICVDQDGFCNASSTGRISSRTSTIGATDVAEMYTSVDPLTPGELVSAASGISVVRASRSTETQLIGIVSTKPGLILGLNPDENEGSVANEYPIGLAGRVPIKVNNEGGPISAGDPITISSTAGVGMKASGTSHVVAIALESFSGSTGTVTGFISKYMIFGMATSTSPTTGLAFNTPQNGLSSGTASSSPSNALSLSDLAASLTIVSSTTVNLGNQIASLMGAVQDVKTTLASTSETETQFNSRLSALETQSGSTTELIKKALILNTMTLSEGLEVTSIGNNGELLALKSDLLFVGRPYFTTDTGGFAMIKKGAKFADVHFDREYLEQPVVNASISLDDASTTADDESLIFKNNMSYLITKKTTNGFRITLNKAAPTDMMFSWITIAVKNARISTSTELAPSEPITPPAEVIITPAPVTPDPVPVTPPSQDASSTPQVEITPTTPAQNSGTSTEPITPEATTATPTIEAPATTSEPPPTAPTTPPATSGEPTSPTQ
jgi:hypothetical protein